MYCVQLDEDHRVIAYGEQEAPDELNIESPWGDEVPPANYDDYLFVNGELVLDPRDIPPAKLSEADAVMAVLKAAPQILAAIPDETLCHMAPYVPAWIPNADYIAGDIRSYEDRAYRCLQPHHSTEEWNPEAAPSLWARILPGQDGEIGIWIQPDSTNPYMKGNRVYWPTEADSVYESDIDNNVWPPNVYGWHLVVDPNPEPEPEHEPEPQPEPEPEIPEWVQPDSTNPYMAGDIRRHNGLVWRSDVDNNVWEPGVYGWTQLLEEE